MKNICRMSVTGATALLCATAAVAADWYYEGSSDIATAIAGHETCTVVFTNSGTYTLSADVSAGGVKFFKQDGHYVMDFRDGNHKLTLGQNLTIGNGRQKIDFLGGVWDLSRYMFNFNKDGTVGAAWNDITLDGCVITNVAVGQSSPVFVNAAENSRFRIINGSEFHCDKTHKLDSAEVRYRNLVIFDNRNQYLGSNGRIATNQYFELSGGSYLKVRDFYLQNTFNDLGDADRELDRKNLAVITGEGTLLDVQRISIGDGTAGNSLVISNGATLVTKTIAGLPAENLRQTPVTVDAATVKIDGHLYLSDGLSGVDMTFTNNAVMQVGVAHPGRLNVYVTNSNNRLAFYGSTLKCARFDLGYGGSTNNVLSVSGSESAVVLDYSVSASSAITLFGSGSYNRFSVSGGAQVDFWDNIHSAARVTELSGRLGSGAGNVLEVTGEGSSLAFSGKFFATNGMENVILVSEGAEMSFEDIFCLGGTGTVLRVENGVLSLNDDTVISVNGGSSYATAMIGGDIGHSGADSANCLSSNATVVVSGDHPQISCLTTAMRFANDSVLRFELPPNGYRPGVIPMDLSYFAEGAQSDPTTRGLRIEFEGLEEFRSNLTTRTDVTLMRCSRGYSDHGAVAEASAALPAGCSLFWQAGEGTEHFLVLRAKPLPKGMVIVIE